MKSREEKPSTLRENVKVAFAQTRAVVIIKTAQAIMISKSFSIKSSKITIAQKKYNCLKIILESTTDLDDAKQR